MGFALGELPDGDIALVCSSALPSDVRRIEYYRDQRLLMLIYEIPEHNGELMHYELNEDVAEKVKKRSSMVIVQPDSVTGQPMGYYTSLIQVGA